MVQADPQHAEIVALLDRVSRALDGLAVRGLRAAGPDDLTELTSYARDLHGLGAATLASSLDELLEATREGRRGAARSLVRTQAGLRVFERLLTLRSVRARLAHAGEE